MEEPEKDYQKNYRRINRETINKKNRERYRKQRNEIYICTCGRVLAVSNKVYHDTQIHLNNI